MSREDSPYIISTGAAPAVDGLTFSHHTALGYPVYKTGKMVPGDEGRLVEQHIAFVEDLTSEPVVLRPRPETATIYFIGPDGGPIKIGWASNITTRLRDLRLANAFPLKLWASVGGPPSLERDYHKRFAAHRLHGEWFARHPDILAEIERLSA